MTINFSKKSSYINLQLNQFVFKKISYLHEKPVSFTILKKKIYTQILRFHKILIIKMKN